MTKKYRPFSWIVLAVVSFSLDCFSASVTSDGSIPQVAFATQEINAALKEVGRDDLQVTLTIQPDKDSPEAFEIKTDGSTHIQIIGSDANGAMYGGIEVAEFLKCGLPIKNVSRQPLMKKRGLKMNMPFDVRSPAYSTRGDDAQINLQNIWDVEFWKAQLDDMARYRYNVLSLWTLFPFTSMIDLPEYKDCAIQDVFRAHPDYLTSGVSGRFQEWDLDGDGNMEEFEFEGDKRVKNKYLQLVKRMTIQEKIAHWKEVFQYAEDRGIEVYFFQMNVWAHNAIGKYEITQDQANPALIKYVRACTKELLLTYPNIKGIGVTSGENDRRELDNTPLSTEYYCYNTFAKGIMDAQADPRYVDREFRFIFRRHGSESEMIADAFKEYTGGILETSTKYAVAHMYSSRRPMEWEKRIVKGDYLKYIDKAWLNLRNDDLFMHRWGSPDFIRELIRNFPHEHLTGFYMGSDGYFWGRDFNSKNPEFAGRLEIDKHWYNFRLVGEMAYNLDLNDDYWRAVLKHRFGLNDAETQTLFTAWETVSEVVPQVNRAVWAPTDGSFAAEMCQGDDFLTSATYYFARPPMILRDTPPAPEQHCISVPAWAENIAKGKEANPADKQTPLEVADNLDGYAAVALEALPVLKAAGEKNAELHELLLDIESMAYLGQYYADKQRSAANLMLYRLTQDQGRHKDAVKYIEDAAAHWDAYRKVLDSHYAKWLHSKTFEFDWDAIYTKVKQEVADVKAEGLVPTVQFKNIKENDAFAAGVDLEVSAEVKAPTGIHEVKLYINGVRVDGATGAGTYTWSASKDELLANLKTDWYFLEAVAVDNNGFVQRESIYINVGNASGKKDDWMFDTFKVIQKDGETLTVDAGEESKEYWDKLEVLFMFDSNGKLKLRDQFLNVLIFKTYSKAEPGPKTSEFVGGAVTTYNLHEPKSVLWSSRNFNRKTQAFRSVAPAEKGFKGPFEFVVTKGKKIAITGMKNGTRQVIWHQDPDYDDWTGKFSAKEMKKRK